MKTHLQKYWIEIGLRFSLAIGFLSAVADRFGLWPEDVSAWGNWSAFKAYTAVLNPWFPSFLIPFVSWVATVLEIGLALLLFIGFKIELTAKISGFLLLSFALAMTLTTGVKGMLDYGVLPLTFAAFSLSILNKNN